MSPKQHLYNALAHPANYSFLHRNGPPTCGWVHVAQERTCLHWQHACLWPSWLRSCLAYDHCGSTCWQTLGQQDKVCELWCMKICQGVWLVSENKEKGGHIWRKWYYILPISLEASTKPFFFTKFDLSAYLLDVILHSKFCISQLRNFSYVGVESYFAILHRQVSCC